MNTSNISFILDHRLMPYRLPFFKQLAEKGYQITVIHPGPLVEDADFLTQRLSKSVKLVPGLTYRSYKHTDSDIVVHMQNIRLLNLWLLTLNPFKKFKLVHWGIGMSSAKGLDLRPNLISRARAFLSRFASAIVLYSDYPLPLFPKSVHRKIFVANNTVFNPLMANYSSEKKSSFLFIGTLNKRKGLDDLLISFSEVINAVPDDDLYLNIIGEGEEKARLEKRSHELGVKQHVRFLGRISTPEEKQIYFKQAIASISPKQAGLSVLESFSYGVPFIAYEKAISGGEHLNIKNGENGYLVDSQKELTTRMQKLYQDRALAKKLGSSAFRYYKDKRQMKHMVEVFDKVMKTVSENESF